VLLTQGSLSKIKKQEGYLISFYPWKESSYILKFLLKDFGVLDFILFRGKRKHIPISIGFKYDIVFYKKENLSIIKEIVLNESITINTKKDFYLVHIIFKLISKLHISEEYSNFFWTLIEEIFSLLKNSKIDKDLIFIKFLISVLKIEGLWKEYTKCFKCHKKFSKGDDVFFDLQNVRIYCSECIDTYNNKQNKIFPIKFWIISFSNWLIYNNIDLIPDSKKENILKNKNEIMNFLIEYYKIHLLYKDEEIFKIIDKYLQVSS